jgi:hypothetical protein
MRRPIETVPKDGKTVILEDEAKGTYELARWSAQEGAWVGKDGKAHNITPTYWHAMEHAAPLEGERKSSSPLQTNNILPNLGADPMATAVSADGFAPPRPVASSKPVSAVSSDKPIPHAKARPSEARRRFAASCGAAMVAVSLTGMYFRSDFAGYVTRHADRSDALAVASMSKGSTLEQPRMISLASPINAGSAPASAGQITVGRAPTQSRENYPRTDATENDLLNARQALAEAEERETRLKQTAETVSAELQRSLEKIATLESELALARQHTGHSTLSPRRARRIPQRRLKQPNPQGFFGVGG